MLIQLHRCILDITYCLRECKDAKLAAHAKKIGIGQAGLERAVTTALQVQKDAVHMRVLDKVEVCEVLGISATQLRRWIHINDDFPAGYILGRKRCWFWYEIHEWVKRHPNTEAHRQKFIEKFEPASAKNSDKTTE